MIVVRQRPTAILGVAAILILFVIFLGSSPSQYHLPTTFRTPFPSSSSSQSKNHAKTPKLGLSSADTGRVTNKTLGFSKVFVVGLPERTDKRDAISLTASLTGFEVEWIDGVKGQNIPDKAVPFGVDRKKLMETNLGSWRGHMNAVRRIVDEGLESAIIMEDDMDWDVRLKSQLELIAAGSRSLQSDLPSVLFPPSHPRHTRSAAQTTHPLSPYGDDWDLLWLGHCGEPFPETLVENKKLPEDDVGRAAMSHKYVIANDATVPPLDKVRGLVNFTAYPPHTRWVHVTAAPICSFAYALSQRGARRVLYDMSVDHLTGPVDNALAWLCRRAVGSWSKIARAAGGDEDAAQEMGLVARETDEPADEEPEEDGKGEVKKPRQVKDRGLDMKCLSVTPPLFFHHRAKGPISSDSDIQDGTKSSKVRDKGTTENIMWSARLNVQNMLLDREMESQY